MERAWRPGERVKVMLGNIPLFGSVLGSGSGDTIAVNLDTGRAVFVPPEELLRLE